MNAKLKDDRRAPTANFDHLKRNISSLQPADAAVQEPMESNLRNYIQTGFEQFKASTKVYQLNVKGDISSLRTGLT